MSIWIWIAIIAVVIYLMFRRQNTRGSVGSAPTVEPPREEKVIEAEEITPQPPAEHAEVTAEESEESKAA